MIGETKEKGADAYSKLTKTPEHLPDGVLVRGMGGLYTVRNEAGEEYTLRCKKKFRRRGLSPLVGDRVLFSPGAEEEHGWLEEILPRTTECLRPPVANVELLLLVIAPVPAPDLLLIDRLLVRAQRQGLHTLLAVNKNELDAAFPQSMQEQYAAANLPVLAVSARERTGLHALRDAMKGQLCCLAGQSGVGKSSLLNALLGTKLETGGISERIRRGKNTTRHAELLERDGLKVLDTAGFQLLEMEKGLDPATLKDAYPDFAPYEGKCRFTPCCHGSEPGCAVTEATERGELHPQRVERYRILLEEVRKAWRERYD